MLSRIKRSRPAQTIAAYGAAQGGNYAAGLAFNAFQAMFPLILGMLAIVGLVIRDPSTQTSLYNGIVSIFPADAHDAILKALQGVRDHAGLFGIVSVVGLLWSGTNLFAAMEFALTKIFGTTQRDALRQRLMGLVMVVVFVTAVLLAVTANSAAALSPGAGVIGSVLAALVLVALMTAIYRWVPNRTFALREIWPGALLAGILIDVFSLVFPLYAKVSKGFGTYGQQFALFFVLATWLMFLSQFILLGAVFNKLRLGAPHDRGIIASPSSASRAHTAPAEAIRGATDRADQARKGSDQPRRSSARGGGDGPRPAPAEAGIAVAVAMAAAALGAVAARRKRP